MHILFIIVSVLLLLTIFISSVALWNRLASNKWLNTPFPFGKMISTSCGKRFINIQGSGRSEKGSLPRTFDRISAELLDLLDTAGVKPPYILVGHSLGGMLMTRFAQLYPEKVKSALLVDPAPLELDGFKEAVNAKIYKQLVDKILILKMMKRLGKLGIIRLLGFCPFKLPPDAKKYFVEHASTPFSAESAIEEFAHMEEGSGMIKKSSFPKIPLTVLSRSAGRNVEIMVKQKIPRETAEKVELVWQETLKQYLKLSPLSRWLVVPDTTHTIHIDQPAAVISEIEKFLIP